jgi:hypothetical protein
VDVAIADPHSHELAGNVSMVLRERMLRLQQQQLAALKVDRVYDDRLCDAIWMNSGLRNQASCRST